MEKISLEQIDSFAAHLLKRIPVSSGASVLALSGDLGAGKTTLAQAIGRVLGVEERIPSPTFLVMRSYQTKHPRFEKFVHIDAYRVDTPSEFLVLKLPELFEEEKTLIAIEWPERLGELLPLQALRVSLKTIGEKDREIRVE